jgi:hypothetical protein
MELFVMKKRNIYISALSFFTVAALFILVQPMQSFAVNALSVFRVQDMHAINITVTDLEQLARSVQELKSMMPVDWKHSEKAISDSEKAGKPASEFVTLNSPRDFTAFDLKLPGTPYAETLELKMIGAQTKTITLDTSCINEKLIMLGADPLSEELDGAQITVQTAGVAVADYGNIKLIATQMPVFTDNDRALTALKQSFLSLPQLPDNLRLQFGTVDLTSGIVYVPVIEGFGQQTSIGGSTGYLYALPELRALIDSLPIDLFQYEDEVNPLGTIQQYNDDGSGLIWTRDGVLYILAGNQPAGELTQIARSCK